MSAIKDQALALVSALHLEVDEAFARLLQHHQPRIVCGPRCTHCCIDELTVFEVEAELVRRSFGELLARGRPAELGRCAMLDPAGSCRIYHARPYVCRTQGLPLRWLDDDPDGNPVEYRDICELNEDGPPLTELGADECWTIGPAEARLQQAQLRWSGGGLGRVALRELFARPTRV